MIESVLIGAGSKLAFNVVNSWFAKAEKKDERKYLQDKETLAAHLELARINSRNKVSNATRSLCALMVIGGWVYIGIYAMHHPVETDILIPIKHGLIGRLFNQPESVMVEGRTPGVLFQYWFEVTIAFVTMFSLPSRRR